MDVYVSPLRHSPRDPALMRMQMGAFFANARKADRNHGFTFLLPPVGMEWCAQTLIL